MLEEEQVGTDPLRGRSKIAKEVLEEMRRFLVADTGETLALKVDKVKNSVREAESDPITQRTVLRLEAALILTTELNKGKGHVFEYREKELERSNWDLNVNPNKLMAASMKANRNSMALSEPPSFMRTLTDESDGELLGTFSKPGSSGIVRKKSTVRRRPPRAQRQRNLLALTAVEDEINFERREGKHEFGSRKRKKTVQGAEEVSTNKAQCLKVIPHEGSPSPQ